MVFTHALAGVVLAGVVALVAPEHAPIALAAGAAGGVLPDLDIYVGHRKTLHFPVYASVGAVPALGLAATVPTAATVALAAALLGAGAHAAMDALGGGLELRPWEATSDRAVYSHFHGRWIEPRRLVRYDGAPEDLLLSALLAVAAIDLFGSPVAPYALGALVVATAYAGLRRPLATLWERLAGRVPPPLAGYLPERFAPAGGPP